MKNNFFAICLLTILLLASTETLFGQKSPSNEEWLPVLETRFPVKFMSLKMDAMLDYGIASKSSIPDIGQGNSEIKASNTATFDVKFPLLNKPGFVLAGSIKFTDEQLYFEKEGDISYPLFVSLNDRNLKKVGAHLNALLHLRANKSLIFRGSFSMAGDFYKDDESPSLKKYIKSSFAVAYAIRRNSKSYLAFGAYYDYTFGVPSIYPAMVWSQRFQNNFGIDAVLPQSIKAWKLVNNNFYVFAETRITGDSYSIHLDNSILNEVETLQLRKSTILATAGLTHKLSKWLWAEAQVGYTKNLNFNLSESNFSKGSTLPKPDNDYIITSSVRDAPFVSFSLFLSPPAGFIRKIRK